MTTTNIPLSDECYLVQLSSTSIGKRKLFNYEWVEWSEKVHRFERSSSLYEFLLTKLTEQHLGSQWWN